MNLAMMVTTDTPEVVWNALRLGNMMLEGMEDVTLFLNGPAVTYAALDSKTFPILELAKIFTLSEGRLLA